MQSGNEGLWPTKRKRYFRLPGEDAPLGEDHGEYASNPNQFKKLAEAAGELLCRSNKPEAIEQWRKSYVKALVSGSSFMPTFIPTGIADQSAKSLLDEYASVLTQAISARSRIKDLWEVLEDTQIGLLPISKDEAELVDHPKYGGAEICPDSIVRSTFRPHITSALFTTSRDDFWGTYVSWAFPSLQLGSIAMPIRLRMLQIPEEKSHLFKNINSARDALTPDAHDWIKSVGFLLNDAAVFPDDDTSQPDNLWTDVMAKMLFNVSLNVRKDDYNEPSLSISVWGDCPYVVDQNLSSSLLSENARLVALNNNLTQHVQVDVSEDTRWQSGIDIIFSNLVDPNKDHDVRAIGILPSGWQVDLKNQDWEVRPIWLDEEAYWASQEIQEQSGWTDNIGVSEILFTGKYQFYPAIAQANPISSILPAGSTGAGILQNALHASGGERISQIVLDRCSEVAHAGLRYYESVLNDYRSAIHRI